jgi:hypothetical protein
VSTDELTGVQALERKHPGLPLAPDHVQRREFEYERHGTRCFILSRDVVTGKLVAPYNSTEVLKRRVFTILCEVIVLSLSLSQGLQFFVVVWAHGPARRELRPLTPHL